MSNAKQTRHVTSASCEALFAILETLPGALFVIDDAERIVYANVSAQVMTGATQEKLHGDNFWRCAPQLVSTALYQAMRKTKQSRALTEVRYISSITRTWLHVHLSPTATGLLLQFHEVGEPERHQQALPQGEHFSLDKLSGLRTRIGILTLGGILLEINEDPLKDSYLLHEEAIGKPLIEAPWWSFSPASQERLSAAIARANTREKVYFEALVRFREGMYRDVEATIIPHVDVDHQVEYLIIAWTDVTERKRAEAEIQALIDAIPQLVWTGRPDGYVDYYNQRWRDYTGMTTEQAQGDGWMQCTHPDDRQRVLRAWHNAVQTGRPCEAEQRLRQGSTGEYRWFLMQATPFKDAWGTILKYIGACTDIHERKQTKDGLHVLVDAIPHFVWMMRPDGSAEYANQRWCDYANVTLEQLQGDGWAQFLHPDEQSRVLDAWQTSVRTNTPYEVEHRFRNGRTGEYRWFLARGIPLRDRQGKIQRWFGTCTDIDDQKRIEAALRQSQERVNVLMNSSIIGIFVSEGEQIVEANDTYLRMTGYTREDLQAGNINWARMTPPEYAAQTQQACQELTTSLHVTRYEKEYICKDGSRLPVVVGAVLLQPSTLQVIGFVLDNSARKELEQRKDDFISMASHELKTPLTSLKLQTQLVKARLARQGFHEAAADIARVEKPIRQLEWLIRELLDVSKIQAGKLEYIQEPVDMEMLLHEVAETLQQMSTTHVIVVRGAASRWLIGDKSRLEQVFTNLISNAIKYSPDSKMVEVDLDTSEEAVTVRVKDHGLGIPREQRDKVFERFYQATISRQRAIPGLGMGLYIAAEIVKRHGGSITVDSEVGKGTTFIVTLPLNSDA